MTTDAQGGTTAAALPLFYRDPRPLDAAADGDIALRRDGGYRFAAGTNSVPVVASEMQVACRHLPIVFTDGEVPQAVCLLGLRNGENLLVDDAGRWEAGVYVPAYVRRYPFIFMENADRSQNTLCIDHAADAVAAGGDTPLFDGGEPTEATRAALEFCRDFQAQHAFTTEFARAVRDAGLLIDNRADVTLNDGRRLSLGGFKVIDRARFDALGDEVFLHWRSRSWLPLAYAHFVSTGTWGALVDRAAGRPG